MNKMRSHAGLLEEEDIFKLYKRINESITSDEVKNRIYEEELIDIINKKLSCNSLPDSIKKLKNMNPFLDGYFPRLDFSANIKKRLNLKSELGDDYFCDRDDEGMAKNHLETMIQRHIMLSDKYEDVLGKSIYFEFPCNTSDGVSRTWSKVPIDLITYKKEENILYLIEFKKPSGVRGLASFSDQCESDETFLRALMEISTYFSFFTSLVCANKDGVNNAIASVGGLDIDIDKVVIKPAIMGPKRLFDDVYCKELKNLRDSMDCFVISLADGVDDLREYKVNSDDKLFEIKEYE